MVMQYEVRYVWNVPTTENIANTEDEIIIIEASTIHDVVAVAVQRLAAQQPPRANMWIDVGDRRCRSAWIKDQPEGKFGYVYVGWNSRFKQHERGMEWYAYADYGSHA
jgi:hypothetical protein